MLERLSGSCYDEADKSCCFGIFELMELVQISVYLKSGMKLY
jgi:hypothetical protein